jgi:hypothetical protein
MRSALVLAVVAVTAVAAAQTAQQGQTTPPPPPPDSAAATVPPPAGTASIQREVFSYGARGRRDPMVSLMKSDDLRPMLQDLELMGLMYDPSGRGSQATLRDLTDASKIYRVRVGQTLGRMQVSAITPKDIEFTIDEFGFSRRERLSLKPDSIPPRAP